MITIAKPLHEDVKAQENHRFLAMLPRIRRQASVAFRRLRPDRKDELIQEVVANAYCAFVRLVDRGKADVAYATPLANFAIRQEMCIRDRYESSVSIHSITRLTVA